MTTSDYIQNPEADNSIQKLTSGLEALDLLLDLIESSEADLGLRPSEIEEHRSLLLSYYQLLAKSLRTSLQDRKPLCM